MFPLLQQGDKHGERPIHDGCDVAAWNRVTEQILRQAKLLVCFARHREPYAVGFGRQRFDISVASRRVSGTPAVLRTLTAPARLATTRPAGQFQAAVVVPWSAMLVTWLEQQFCESRRTPAAQA